MNPPPNVTICTGCGRENCKGHPILTTVYMMALVALAVLILLSWGR